MKKFLALVCLLSIVGASELSLTSSITAGQSGTGELTIAPVSTNCIDAVTVDVDPGIVVSGYTAIAGKCICVAEICDEEYYDDSYVAFLAVYADESVAGDSNIKITIDYADGTSETLTSALTVNEAEKTQSEEIPIADIRTSEIIMNQTWDMLFNFKVRLESVNAYAEEVEKTGVMLTKEKAEIEALNLTYNKFITNYNVAASLFNESQYKASRDTALSIQSEHYIYLAKIDDTENEIRKAIQTRNEAVTVIKDVLESIDLTIYDVSECESIGGCKQLRASADSLQEQIKSSVAALDAGQFGEARALAKAAEIGNWDLKIKTDEEIEFVFSSAEDIILSDLVDITEKGKVIGISTPTLLSLTNTSRLDFEDRRENVCRAIPKVSQAAKKTSSSLTSYVNRKTAIVGKIKEANEIALAGVTLANANNVRADTSSCAYDLERAVELLSSRNLYEADNAVDSALKNCDSMKVNVEKEVENEEKLRSMSLASKFSHLIKTLKIKAGLVKKFNNEISIDNSVLAEAEAEVIENVSLNPFITAFEGVACSKQTMPSIVSTEVDIPDTVSDPEYKEVKVKQEIEKVHKVI